MKRGLKNKLKAAEIWEPRRDDIERMYYADRMSMEAIAELYGVSKATIPKVMARLGIPSRGRARSGPENGRYIDGSQSRPYRQMIDKDKCATCDAVEELVIHHKNGNHSDNRLLNLQVLCNRCHTSHHKSLWWAKKRGPR